MTIDQLCELDAAQLEQLSDAQLLEIFGPSLKVTRPELAKVNKPQSKHSESAVKLDPKKAAALAMLGIDPDIMRRNRKR